MIKPSYHMALVSLIASFALLVGLLCFRFIYPKKKVSLFTLFLWISILPLLSLLRPGDYQSGDFNIHIYRIMSFYDSLLEGHFLPSWAGMLNATYGYPLFIFNYPLPYYFVAVFHFLEISFINGMKVYLGINLFLSGFFMYLWIKKLVKAELAAFTSSIFYLFNPYHLIDVHFRATLGEVTIFTLAPLLFLFLTNYLKEKKLVYLPLVGIITAFLFMAHALLAGVILGVAFFYPLLFVDIRKKIIQYLSIAFALLLGVLASTYTWIGFIVYGQDTITNKEIAQATNIGFYTFNQLFYAPWKLGFLFQGPHGELALIIGYSQLLILAVSIILFFTGKIPQRLLTPYLFWICFCLLFIFLMNPVSAFLWKFVPFLQSLLPTGRLSLLISICTSVMAGYFVEYVVRFNQKKKKNLHIRNLLLTKPILLHGLIIVTIAYTILNWGQRTMVPSITDTQLRQNLPYSTAQSEGHFYANSAYRDPKHPWFDAVPKKHIIFLQGSGEAKEIIRTSTIHSYVVNTNSPTIIQENTLYFPGWQLTSNNVAVTIYPGKEGIINAKLPVGLQYLELAYTDIPEYKIAKLISIIFTLFLLLLTILLILPSQKYFERTRDI